MVLNKIIRNIIDYKNIFRYLLIIFNFGKKIIIYMINYRSLYIIIVNYINILYIENFILDFYGKKKLGMDFWEHRYFIYIFFMK